MLELDSNQIESSALSRYHLRRLQLEETKAHQSHYHLQTPSMKNEYESERSVYSLLEVVRAVGSQLGGGGLLHLRLHHHHHHLHHHHHPCSYPCPFLNLLSSFSVEL